MYKELETVKTLPSTNGHASQETSVPAGIDRVIAAFEALGQEPKYKSGGYIASCPLAHNHKSGDSSPSLGFKEVVNEEDSEDRTVVIHCFSGACDFREILQALNLKMSDLYSKYDATSRHSLKGYLQRDEARKALTVDTLSRAKLIPLDFLMMDMCISDDIFTFHSSEGEAYKKKGVCFPYLLPDGTPHERAKLRVAMSKVKKGDSIFYWKEGDDKPILFALQCLLEARRLGYGIINEGETDSTTLLYHGFPAFGVSGAGNTEKIIKATLELVPDLFEGIDTFYVNQEKTDQPGVNFPFNVQLALRKFGFTGKILRIPLRNITGAKDPSELHINLWDRSKPRDHEQFRKIFQQCLDQAVAMDYDTGKQDEAVDISPIDEAIASGDAKAVIKLAPLLAQLSRLEYTLLKVDIKKAFGRDININDLDATVNAARKDVSGNQQNKIDMDSAAETFKERYGHEWRYDLDAQKWRKWTGTHWREQTSENEGKYELDALLTPIIHELGFDINSNSLISCAHRLAEGKCKDKFYPQANLVNFTNGTLEVPSLEFRDHNKEDNLIDCLNYEYRPEMPYIRILTFLSEIFSKRVLVDGQRVPDWHAVQAFCIQIGLAVIQDTSMNNFEVMYGATRGGKSTAMRLANAACGVTSPGATVEETYGSFAGDDLFLNELEGKRSRYARRHQKIVCADELSYEALKQEEMIKNMSGHSGVSMRGMNKDEETRNTWLPKIIMSTNNLPSYLDYAGAVKERVIYLPVPFKREKSERDLKLLPKLLGELPGFIHLCIQLGLEAIERGYYPQSAEMKELTHAAEANGNALKAFIEDYCILEPNAVMLSATLYSRFMEYRNEKGHTDRYSQQTMVANLKNMNIGVHNNDNKASRAYDGTPRKGLLFGIRMRETTDPLVEIVHDDDALLMPELCNLVVTSCNHPVTSNSERGYKNDGALDGSASDLNASDENVVTSVTSKNENWIDKGTPTFRNKSDGVKGRCFTSGSENTQNEVTEVTHPTQPACRANKNVTSGGYKEVTREVTKYGMEDARKFVNDFCSIPNQSLVLLDGGNIGISVPESMSDEEFNAIDSKVKLLKTWIVAILSA